jgi:hypothetical protein
MVKDGGRGGRSGHGWLRFGEASHESYPTEHRNSR